MRFSAGLVALVTASMSVLECVTAFPSIGREVEGQSLSFSEGARLCPKLKARIVAASAESADKLANMHKRDVDSLVSPNAFKFDEKAQHLDVSGEHEWRAPQPGDIRGPCPGLNVLANHGFFPRNGVVPLAQAVEVVEQVYGISPDLGAVLSTYATVFTGNIGSQEWSIGGPFSGQGLGAVNDLIGGQAGGLRTHNIYEGDASVTRRDYYEPGANRDNVHTYLPYFQSLVDIANNNQSKGVDVYTRDLVAQHRWKRFQDSIQTNPNFFYSPFGGLLVTTAAHDFIVNFMANNTADANGNNRIYLDEDNLFPFFSITRDSKSGALSYTPGHEKFPDNWYRRPLAATYGVADVVVNILKSGAEHPELLSVGGNTGTVNSFAGVNAADLTGGALNTAQLLSNPAAMSCFLYQALVESVIPTQLRFLYKDASVVSDLVTSAITGPFKGLAAKFPSCSTVKVDMSQTKKFPGSTISNGKSTKGLADLLTK